MRRLGMLLLVIALAACGSGAEESDSLPDTVEEITTTVPPEGRALADWREAASTICTTSFPKIQAAAAELGQPETPEELVARLDPFIAVVVEAYDALLAIPVPTEHTRDVNELHDRLNRGKQALAGIRASAARGDIGSYQESVGHLVNYADAGEVFESLEVTGCL